MSFDAFLIHTCTIERVETPGTNAHGLASDEYDTLAEDQPCRLVAQEERLATGDKAERPLVTVYKLLLPSTADIQKNDRVTVVTLEDGNELGGVFRVNGILPRRAKALRHISARLERLA